MISVGTNKTSPTHTSQYTTLHLQQNTYCNSLKAMSITKSDLENLRDKSLSARDFSYSPYSNFRVGAVLLTESGEWIQGANIENASYGGAICAERVAITRAIVSTPVPKALVGGGFERHKHWSERSAFCVLHHECQFEDDFTHTDGVRTSRGSLWYFCLTDMIHSGLKDKEGAH